MVRADRPHIPTTIIDNFFETPSLWRDFALAQEYYKGERGTWPGTRTAMLSELSSELYEILEIRLLEQLPMFTGLSKVESTFQLIDETWGKGWVHDDNPEHDVAGIIYLNKGATLNTGTTMYEGAADINGEHYSKLFQEDVLSTDPEVRKGYAKYRDEQRAFFKPAINVDCVWNRCVMFDPRTWHSADNFFGTTKDDTRLTLVFFGNT